MQEAPPNAVFAVFDTETTGLRAENNRIIEIAIVFCDRFGNIVGEYETLVNPKDNFVGETAIHRITSHMVQKAPTFDQLAPQLAKLLQGKVLVAHNAGFDLRFLEMEFIRCGFPLHKSHTICTVQLTRKIKKLPSHKLSALCHHYGIPLVNAHAALDDARATALLLQKCLEHLEIARQTVKVYHFLEDHLAQRKSSGPWPTLAPNDTRPVTREETEAKRSYIF